ncbi:MAG: choice-of-anchor B family protein [Gemmatimonadetes bacterium]|nr:choice-of-anchor B family protein [Gemmatimonadota bacterium]
MPGRLARTLATALLLVPVSDLGGQQFGGALAVTGDQIVVGESRNGTLSGILYVYGREGGRWTEVDQLKVSDENRTPDGFGRAVAAGSDLLVVGAPLEDDGAGAVYTFRREGAGEWSRRMRLRPREPLAGGGFGSTVALGDDRLVVAAPEGSDGAGVVYVFDRDGETWTETARLDASDEEAVGFGTMLALEADRLLVAGRSVRGAPAAVRAYRHAPEDGSWSDLGALAIDELPERSEFGVSVAWSDDLALVGAPGVNDRAGVVFAFGPAEDGIGWQLSERLGPALASPNASFGRSIEPRDGTVVVGAPGTRGGGTFYEFTREAERWTGAALAPPIALDDRAQIGQTLAIGQDLAVAGASGVDSGAGAVVVFERGSGGGWEEGAVLVNEMRGFEAITGAEIECEEGQAAYFDCRDVNLLSFLPIKDLGGSRGTRVNDIWGWTDAQTGREYAIVGRTDGTAFVDISDPHDPRYLGELPATEGSRHMIWRDIKVYRDHAYVVADAALEHGVQVFDLRQLRDVGDEPVTFAETFLYDGIHSAHNIVINEETGFAYAVGNSGGGETCGGGLHMIDLEDPARPAFAGCFAQEGTGRRGTGYVHDAQCVIYRGPDAEHVGKEICLGSNENALNIADVTDKDAPIGLSTLSYPNVAYAHQGWLTEDHRYFYMNDEGDEPQGLVEGTRTLVWDVTDLDDPILVNEHIAETTATDHNLYVVGDLMYQSNYSAGFRVLDISDPANPVEVGFLDTSPYEGGASWSNYPFFESGTIAVTGTGDGLFLLRNDARPRLVP